MQKALKLARELSHSYTLAMIMSLSAFVSCRLRDIDKTEKAAEEAIEYSTKNSFTLPLGTTKVLYLWSLGMQKKEDKRITSKMYQEIEELRKSKGIDEAMLYGNLTVMPSWVFPGSKRYSHDRRRSPI